jgi:hypothetical protein
MENVLVALVIIFLVLFAALTLGNAIFSTQDMLNASQAETETRLQEQSRTQLALVDVKTHAGTQAEITLRNTGSVKLADFDQWDVIVQYFDDAAPAGYHIDWLPYTATLVGADQWTVQGIYSDVTIDAPEVYEPHIFNPGEQAVLDVRLSPPIAAGTYAQLVITAPNGATATTIFRRNVPPVLVTNLAIVVNSGESVTIDKTYLETTDIDDEPLDLVYAVTVPPTQGTLDPDTEFTQSDINNGLLQYTDTGAISDTFEFTVSDGEDGVGPYTFNITVNLPPSLDVNIGMSVPQGMSGALGDLLLKTTDPDNTLTELIYTVTTPPSAGTLSMTTFSQTDIDNGSVNYLNTNTSATTDSFEFTVTDGHKVIGPFSFAITTT